ncbi:hypothetical protein IV72_GL000867 [Atopobium minutum]|nr:hypothetical protein IV72_GL000867 [Atopobium minutum]
MIEYDKPLSYDGGFFFFVSVAYSGCEEALQHLLGLLALISTFYTGENPCAPIRVLCAGIGQHL